MVTNFYFQNYQNTNEQRLLNDLVAESIRIYGIDCYYLPRVMTNYDNILTEDAQSSYESVYMTDAYLKNFMGFTGDRNLMTKFAGLEIRDQIIFNISKTSFHNDVEIQTGISRPREGDIMYFPLPKKCFIIRYVEAYEFMFSLGALYTWEVTLELFEYSNEKFNTGIPEIDILQSKFSTNALDYALKTENGDWLTTETGAIITNENFIIPKIDPISQNEIFDQKTLDLDLIDWAEVDPFSEGKIGNR